MLAGVFSLAFGMAYGFHLDRLCGGKCSELLYGALDCTLGALLGIGLFGAFSLPFVLPGLLFVTVLSCVFIVRSAR
jgi:hypothetical protein